MIPPPPPPTPTPIRRQAIILINAEFLFITPLGTNFIDILIKIQNFPLAKMYLKISRP